MAKVLIVEDNPEHVDLARRVLSASGYEVLAAGDAQTGLEIATDHLPDIILLDLGLPDIDGQTLLGWMRKVPGLEHTPIIAVTAWPPGIAPQMVEAYGFDGYITKPISFRTFGDKIAAFLSSGDS